MTDEFKHKILLIREKGEPAFKGLVDQNLAKRQEVEHLIGELDTLVNRELERDRQMQSMGGSYTTFPQAFGEHIQNLNQIKSTVGGYKSMHDRLVSSHNQYKNWLPKLSDPNLNINELLKIPDLEEFVKANGEDLTNLKKLYDGIQMILNQHIAAEQNLILQALEEVNVESQARKILMNETNLESIYKDINEKIGPLSLSFEEKVVLPNIDYQTDDARRKTQEFGSEALSQQSKVVAELNQRSACCTGLLLRKLEVTEGCHSKTPGHLGPLRAPETRGQQSSRELGGWSRGSRN